MKGVINKGIQELVEEKFGEEAWEKVKEVAKCDEPFFSASEDYPDQLTVDLANAASVVSGLPLDTVLVEFGRHWVTKTSAESYPTIYKLTGKTTRDFLLSMVNVHEHVTKGVANARPPVLEFEDLPDGTMAIHYLSERNLCPVLRGCILGAGDRFGEKLEVRETSCVADGADRCTMEVTFNVS